MTIWILALVLMAMAVSAGYVQGGIRVAFSLVGIAAGILLAMPLSPYIVPLLPYVGITSSWTQAVVAPIVAFFAVGIAFKVAGNFVHRKVDYHFKYRMSDSQRALWERMHRRVGAALGSIGGVVYFLLACLLISTIGYFTIQVGAEESSSNILRAFSRMGQDLVETHMDKVVGGMNPAPESYYDLCDFLGFLDQNRDVFRRVRTYPPIAAHGTSQYLDDDPEKNRISALRSVVDDTDYFRMLSTVRDPAVILENSRTQDIVTNTEIRTFLATLDTKDLRTYLQTGRSPKYADERILGTWTNDFPASLMQTKRERPNISAIELILYEREMPERLDSAELVATLDNVISIKLPRRLENTAVPSVSNAPPRVSYTGRWRRSGSGYTLDLHARGGGRAESVSAVVERVTGPRPPPFDRISFQIDHKTVCFDRIPE